MKTIYFILKDCDNNLETLCSVVFILIIMAIIPGALCNIHWLCGVLSIGYEFKMLDTIYYLIRKYDKEGDFDKDEKKEEKSYENLEKGSND